MTKGKSKLIISIEDLKPYWKRARELQHKFMLGIRKIEREMQDYFKDDDIDFWMPEGDLWGIGTYPHTDKMKLVHSGELD